MRGRDPMNMTCQLTSAWTLETNRSLCSSLFVLTFNPGGLFWPSANLPLLKGELSPHGSIIEALHCLNRCHFQAKSSIRSFILHIGLRNCRLVPVAVRNYLARAQELRRYLIFVTSHNNNSFGNRIIPSCIVNSTQI